MRNRSKIAQRPIWQKIAATKYTENNAFAEVAGNSYPVTHACTPGACSLLFFTAAGGNPKGKSRIALGNNASRVPGI